MNICGFEVIEDINMVEPGCPKQVGRTWSERWFTCPWHPLTKTKTIIPLVPMKTGIILDTRILVHPDTLKILILEQQREAMQRPYDAPFSAPNQVIH